jgi:DNA invertase Pin-like site-specific DNA recombinase
MGTGKYVVYCRVSTARQGASGLGLEAQRAAVNAHLNGGNWKIVGECVEVESGKNDDRPQLMKALRLCRVHRATLLVAKLDRLSRDLAFIAVLMKEGVKFKAADMPDADETHLHMMAVFAQHEARMISTRTKAALAAKKARGAVLGGRRVSAKRWAAIAAEGRKASIESRVAGSAERAKDLLEMIEDVKQEIEGPASLRKIAEALNKRDLAAPRGGKWSAVQVSRVLAHSEAAVPVGVKKRTRTKSA